MSIPSPNSLLTNGLPLSPGELGDGLFTNGLSPFLNNSEPPPSGNEFSQSKRDRSSQVANLTGSFPDTNSNSSQFTPAVKRGLGDNSSLSSSSSDGFDTSLYNSNFLTRSTFLGDATYTGSDIRVMIDCPSGNGIGKQLLEITTLTVSIHREKPPIRALGYIGPKSFARGRRTTAGTLILTQSTVDSLYEFLYSCYTGKGVSQDSQYIKVDQLPPFNITIYFADETGHKSYRRLLGVDFVDDGTVYSTQDGITEQSLTYQAADFTPLLPGNQSAKSSDYTPQNAPVLPKAQTIWTARAKDTGPNALDNLEL